jgi:hypothetical protein
MPRGFEDTGAYPQWPKVADAVIEAKYNVLKLQY